MTSDIAIASHPEGSLLDVWVIPYASRSEVAGVHDRALRVRVAAPPESGRANRVLLKVLSKALGVGVRLERGTTSRRKQLVVVGLDPQQVLDNLI